MDDQKMLSIQFCEEDLLHGGGLDNSDGLTWIRSHKLGQGSFGVCILCKIEIKITVVFIDDNGGSCIMPSELAVKSAETSKASSLRREMEILGVLNSSSYVSDQEFWWGWIAENECRLVAMVSEQRLVILGWPRKPIMTLQMRMIGMQWEMITGKLVWSCEQFEGSDMRDLLRRIAYSPELPAFPSDIQSKGGILGKLSS
ncbi:hypothetical protein CK203_008585 [Vitis vinifera]|uniref:Uncharacterized protein n=1 Tax=Vitis vinifera TaxID=29760 RepID=A0A438KD98_VITVI|nr:hypothetical protein CK203_008585 [Vitis vinifera]